MSKSPNGECVSNARFANVVTVLVAAVIAPWPGEFSVASLASCVASPSLCSSAALFVLVASLNHAFPVQLAPMTHAVKAFWGLVLYDSVALRGPAEAPLLAPLSAALDFAAGDAAVRTAMFVVTLLPATGNRLAARLEYVPGVVRQAMMLYGLLRSSSEFVHPVLEPLVMLALYVMYGVERRERMGRNARFDYGMMHCGEHLLILMYLVRVCRLEVTAALAVPLVAYLAVVMVVVPYAGVALVHWYLTTTYKRRLPVWFPPTLLPVFERKLRANVRSTTWRNHTIKAFSPYLTVSTHGSWAFIEEQVQHLHPTVTTSPDVDTFDVCLGLCTGGAFVAAAVGYRFGLKFVGFIDSKLYSGSGCLRGLVQTVACVSPTLVSHHHSALTAFQRDVSAADALGAASAALQKPVSELKIMVVDDTVFSGRSLSQAVRFVAAMGADPRNIKTAALVVLPHKEHSYVPDYFAFQGPIPWIWEWGVEVD